jgi:hypothetical protein
MPNPPTALGILSFHEEGRPGAKVITYFKNIFAEKFGKQVVDFDSKQS